MNSTFDYYFAWIMCPVSIFGLLWMFYTGIKEPNKAGKALCYFYSIVFAADTLITFKIIMFNKLL